MRTCSKVPYLSKEQQNSLDLSCKSSLTETIWGQTVHHLAFWSLKIRFSLQQVFLFYPQK